MPHKSLIHAALLSLAMTSPLALAGVYKCLDENNKIVYQDKACQELKSARVSPALSRLAPESNKALPLWKASADNKTLLLLGSLSYGSGDMFPLPEAIMDTFAGTNVLIIATELDNGAGTTAASLTSQSNYADGSTLEDHVKPSTWRKVQEAVKKLGVKPETISAEKPWKAALTLKGAALKQAGFDLNLSVDRAVLDAAKTQKPVIQLDPAEDQVKSYDELAADQQEQLLLQALNEADGEQGYFKALADAWQAGDARSVELIVRRSLDSLPNPEALMKQWTEPRNQALVNKLDELAADGRTYFIVVDTRRLVGDNGVLDLLEKKGFTLSQI
jgi:uncharacterized protein YbaP (TraB family)